MSEGLNKVILLGNLGQDPELRFTQGGAAVLNIRMATTEVYFDKERQKKEQTDWHSVTVWGNRAEALSKILTKGSTILVEGSIRNSTYEGRDGQKKYKSEVNAKNVVLAGSGGSRGGEPQRQAPAQDDRAATYTGPSDAFGPDGDDIPF